MLSELGERRSTGAVPFRQDRPLTEANDTAAQCPSRVEVFDWSLSSLALSLRALLVRPLSVPTIAHLACTYIAAWSISSPIRPDTQYPRCHTSPPASPWYRDRHRDSNRDSCHASRFSHSVARVSGQTAPVAAERGNLTVTSDGDICDGDSHDRPTEQPTEPTEQG